VHPVKLFWASNEVLEAFERLLWLAEIRKVKIVSPVRECLICFSSSGLIFLVVEDGFLEQYAWSAEFDSVPYATRMVHIGNRHCPLSAC
jgi:hypothetical protein